MAEMTEQQALICRVIEACDETHFSAKYEQQVATQYGDEVAKATRRVYDETVGCPVDWRKATMDDGLAILAETCHEKFPWLTEAARLTIVHWFVIAWK